MELSQGTKDLMELVKKAYNGEVMLPDFQRNFIWARNDVEELLMSLLQNMFIGNFLIHNIDPANPPFKPIQIEGTSLVNKNFKPKPNILVLDGQQRLSSVFYALYGPDIPLKNASNPYAFFINIYALIEDNEEDFVFSVSKEWKYYKQFFNKDCSPKFEELCNEGIIPLTLLTQDFTDIWYLHYRDTFKKNDKKIREYINNIINYKILTLDVPLNEKPENIAILFERINRTGVKLSSFDLLVARLYKFINLRTEWEAAFDANDNIKEYSFNKRETQIPYYLIQALALHYGLSIKARDMLKIDEHVINDDNWNMVVNVVEKNTLERLLDINEYGIGNLEKWSPYSPIITPFTAALMHKDHDIDKINKWYWSTIFTERYGGSTDTKITKDYKDLIQWFKNDKNVPEAVSDLSTLISSKTFNLLDKTNSGNSVYKGVFNLLFINQAKDFYENDKLKFNDELDDHHIFPKQYLLDRKISDNKDSVLNKTLISSPTNRSIYKNAPATYLKEMIKRYGNEAKVKALLKNHFINEKMFDLMKQATETTKKEDLEKIFNKFMSLRMLMIQQHIEQLITL